MSSSYATLDQLKAYIPGITSSSTNDDLLEDCLARATAAIETFCGRKFKAESDTTRHFDAVRDVCGTTLYVDEDLAQITSIVNGDGQTLSPSVYTTEPRNRGPYFAIKIKLSSSALWMFQTDPEDAISITGRWAFSVTPPADIVQSCLRLAAFYYKLKDSQVFDVTADPQKGMVIIPKGIPQDVKLLLVNYVRVG